jgi:hypothetical protein
MDVLRTMISDFPATNSPDADMYALRDKMKNKMRVITSLLNVQQKYIIAEPPKMTY